ncbi:glycosyltransferase family 8 protein [Pluteus cervinus]|uniref:Glycosyltransferase family 8 protein n=1 Tax=Pluteus cervinus TaxID=181527 RepID=A0ACD3BCZ2_9AGAR|nr:glycosyltransferase family 8 protein [Pluteus cervinus]
MNLRHFLPNSWSYAYSPLPTTRNRPGKSRECGYRYVMWTVARVVLNALFIWLLVRIFSKHYTPLDNYQNINHYPLVHANYTPTPHDRRAVVSSLYSDSFTMAIAVLGYSVLKANIHAHLVLPYLESQVSKQALCIASAIGWTPLPVPFIPPPHHGKGIHYRFSDQYTKLNIWGLDKAGYDRVVYLDADTLVRRNFDELFDGPFDFAVVPDVYRPNDSRGFSITFNAGVIALRTSSALLKEMLDLIPQTDYPLDEAEQAFLNQFYSAKALRLPYAYNANLAIKTRSPQLWEGMKAEMRIVHYTLNKPWMTSLDQDPHEIVTLENQRGILEKSTKRNGGLYAQEVGWWVDVFEEMVAEKGEQLQACYL